MLGRTSIGVAQKVPLAARITVSAGFLIWDSKVPCVPACPSSVSATDLTFSRGGGACRTPNAKVLGVAEGNQTRGLTVVNHWPVFDFADQRSPIMTADLERKHEGEHREQVKRRREERELDEALDDSFPASDPPAITQPTPTPEQDDKSKKKKRRSAG